MTCENIVGVKNILMSFKDCDRDVTIGPIEHQLAGTDMPTWRNCAWTSERLPGGYVRRQAADASVQLTVIRDLRIPLSYYQGCASIDIQVEYHNGLVQTGIQGGVIGEEKSDTHEVTMEITFKQIDELLPPGSLAAA